MAGARPVRPRSIKHQCAARAVRLRIPAVEFASEFSQRSRFGRCMSGQVFSVNRMRRLRRIYPLTLEVLKN